jgi:hypothetical protein
MLISGRQCRHVTQLRCFLGFLPIADCPTAMAPEAWVPKTHNPSRKPRSRPPTNTTAYRQRQTRQKRLYATVQCCTGPVLLCVTNARSDARSPTRLTRRDGGGADRRGRLLRGPAGGRGVLFEAQRSTWLICAPPALCTKTGWRGQTRPCGFRPRCVSGRRDTRLRAPGLNAGEPAPADHATRMHAPNQCTAPPAVPGLVVQAESGTGGPRSRHPGGSRMPPGDGGGGAVVV